MRIAYGMDTVTRKKVKNGPKKPAVTETVGERLEETQQDQHIKSEPEDNKRRRSILIQKLNGCWGFTVQTYGIHHKLKNELEFLTYVDYVDRSGPAYLAGLRSGDVILAVNGVNMEHQEHVTLVNFIKKCDKKMRLVVLFEDCCRKVELHSRYIKLKRVLQAKLFEHRSLEQQERTILEGSVDPRRLSLASNSSSPLCVGEDRLSLRPELDLCPETTTVQSADYSTCSLDSRHPRDGGATSNTRSSSLKLKRPNSSFDLKFPAIAEFDSSHPEGTSTGGLQRNVSAGSIYDRRAKQDKSDSKLMPLSCLSTRASRILLPKRADQCSQNFFTPIQPPPPPRNHSASELVRPSVFTAAILHRCASTSTLTPRRGQQQLQGDGFARSPLYCSTPQNERSGRPTVKRSSSHAANLNAVLIGVKPLTDTNNRQFGFSNLGRHSHNWGRQLPNETHGRRKTHGQPSHDFVTDDRQLDDAGIVWNADDVFGSPVHELPSAILDSSSPSKPFHVGMEINNSHQSSKFFSPNSQKLSNSSSENTATNIKSSRSLHTSDSSDYYSLTPPTGKRSNNTDSYRFFPDRVYALDGSLIGYHGNVAHNNKENTSAAAENVYVGLINESNEDTAL